MHHRFSILLMTVCCAAFAVAQTADELIAKNIQAKGGMEKIRAVQTVRMVGRLHTSYFDALISQESKRPEMLRQVLTIQGMNAIQAFDGTTAWQIQPFYGRKDPELMGEDDARDVIEDADFDGPMVDYEAKGNTVEFLGHEPVDGDDALKLKVTLKNGDILYYYLDPDTFLEFRRDKQQFVRGNVRDTVLEAGSYKPVAGVMYPFSLETGPKSDPSDRQKVVIDHIEVNVPMNDAEFKMPSAPPAGAKK